jgi:hypothetical protein
MTDLTDRMRTCAAAILAGEPTTGWVSLVMHDAADLLIEASNALGAAPAPLGEPMEIIPPVVTKPKPPAVEGAWIAIGDTLPVARLRPLRACPKCDSHAAKRVRRDGNHLMLVCPVCAETWEFKL